tara:strand:+ start:332 stop:811 length:480 start_codon:yes stop_codon:yes gene_type:complete
MSTCIEIVKILAALVAIGGFAFTIYKYFDARTRELKWKRVEFIFGQALFIDQDREINYAISVLAGTRNDYTINDVFDENGAFLSQAESKYKLGFEKLLNLLDRLAYAHLQSNVLELGEMSNFHWYYASVLEHSRVIKHCEKNGFGDVVKMAQELESNDT